MRDHVSPWSRECAFDWALLMFVRKISSGGWSVLGGAPQRFRQASRVGWSPVECPWNAIEARCACSPCFQRGSRPWKPRAETAPTRQSRPSGFDFHVMLRNTDLDVSLPAASFDTSDAIFSYIYMRLGHWPG
jgi:hypothetical protein